MIKRMRKDDELKVLSESTSTNTSPYLCIDLSQRNKVLVSRWNIQNRVHHHAKDQQQAQTQLPQRQQRMTEVSKCCLPSPSLGMTLAQRHSKEKYLNLMFRQWTPVKVESEFKMHDLSNLWNDKYNTDRTVALAKTYGVNVCSTIMKNLKEDYRRSLVVDTSTKQHKRLGHPSILKRLSSSSDNSSTCSSPSLTDSNTSRSPSQPCLSLMEQLYSSGRSLQSSLRTINTNARSKRQLSKMTSLGQVGRDVGMPLTYPIALALTCAMQGDHMNTQEIVHCLDRFWESYTTTLIKRGKDEQFIANAKRTGLGWCGWFLYISCYRMNTYLDVLPLETLSDEDKEIVLDSIGCIGLQLMHHGFASPSSGFEIDSDEFESSKSSSSSSSSGYGHTVLMEDEDKVDHYSVEASLMEDAMNEDDHRRSSTQEIEEMLKDEIANLLEVSLLNQSFFLQFRDADATRPPTHAMNTRVHLE